MVKEYAVTIKIQKTDRLYLACDYDAIIAHLRKIQSAYGCEFDVRSYVFELDKLGKVHYHGIWRTIKGTPLFRKFNHSGCTCMIKEVYYRSGWSNYMKKEMYNNLFKEVNADKSIHAGPVSSTCCERGPDVSLVTLKDLFN